MIFGGKTRGVAVRVDDVATGFGFLDGLAGTWNRTDYTDGQNPAIAGVRPGQEGGME